MSNPYAPPPTDAPSRADDGSRGAPGGHGHAPGGPPHGPAGRPARRPGRRTPERPPDPAEVEALARRTGHLMAFLVATLLVTTMRFPVSLAAAGFAIGAVVVGVRAVVLARRAGIRSPALGALSALVALAGLMVLSYASMLLVLPAQAAHVECLRLAVTTSARAECDVQLQRDVEEITERLRPAGGG